MRLAATLPLLVGVLLLDGCLVGPNYERPAVRGSEVNWIEPGADGPVASHWWQALKDPVLDALVTDALTDNLDIRQAQARLLEVRANRRAIGAHLLPEADAKGSAAKNEVSANGQIPIDRIPGFARRYSLFDAGFDASWEIDLWGGIRRSVEGANAREASAQARIADVRLQTIAETIRLYADMRKGQRQLSILRSESELRAASLALMEERQRSGEASRGDLLSAAERAANARAALPGAGADLRASMVQLALLCGRPPEALIPSLTPEAPLPVPPEVVATGIRSELLERRADVRSAEAELAAANADIGVETANLFPRFTLAASIGQQSQRAVDFGTSTSTRYQFGPTFSWPLFAAGRIRAQIVAANARATEAAAVYTKAVLSALADSETAVNRFAAAKEVARARGDALIQDRSSLALVELRVSAGEDDQLALLEARSAEQNAEQLALAARADVIAQYVALAKALGGGWNSEGL